MCRGRKHERRERAGAQVYAVKKMLALKPVFINTGEKSSLTRKKRSQEMTEGMSTKDIQSEECKDKTDVKSSTLLCYKCTGNSKDKARQSDTCTLWPCLALLHHFLKVRVNTSFCTRWNL